MGKLSAGFDLATELRAQERRASRLAQAALAVKANLAERTVRALEQGSGTLDSWHAVLRALGLRLSGRNLPGGATLGLPSQRFAAAGALAGGPRALCRRDVGPPLAHSNAKAREGFRPCSAVLVVLGAGPYLAEGSRRSLLYSRGEYFDAPERGRRQHVARCPRVDLRKI